MGAEVANATTWAQSGQVKVGTEPPAVSQASGTDLFVQPCAGSRAEARPPHKRC